MKQLFLAIALMWASVAQANIIEISTDQVDVEAGDVVTFTIDLVDFEEFDFLTFSLSFDDSLLGFDSASLTSDFALVDFNAVFDGLDLSEDFGVLFFTLSGDFFTAETFMGDYNLAIFTFTAIDTGTANFTPEFASFDSLLLGQTELDTPTFRVAVEPTAVSEPSTLGLFAALLIAGGALRRRSLTAK